MRKIFLFMFMFVLMSSFAFADDVYIYIEADDVTGDWTLDGGVLTQVSTNMWKFNITSGTDEEKRAKLYETLFNNQRANSTFITNPTAIYTSIQKDDGKRGLKILLDSSTTDSSQQDAEAELTGNFTDQALNTNSSFWWSMAQTRLNGDSIRETDFNADANNVIETSGIISGGAPDYNSYQFGTDTTTDEQNNPNSFYLRTRHENACSSCMGHSQVNSVFVIHGNVTNLSLNEIASTGTNSFIFNDFTANYSTPLFSYIEPTFQLFTYDFWDNSFTNNVTANISFNNGSSYLFTNTTGNFMNTNFFNNLSEEVNITITAQDHFNLDILNHNISNNLDAFPIQTDIKFNASDLQGNPVYGNFTVNSTTQENDTSFYLSQGIYSVTFSAEGYLNQPRIFNITALQNETLAFLGITDIVFNISTTNLFNGSPVNNYQANFMNLFNNLDSNATGNNVSMNLLQDFLYNITLTSTDYFTDTYLNYNVTNNPLLAQLISIGDLNLSFFDQTSLNAITQSVNITIQDNTSQTNYNNITGGTALINNLVLGTQYVIYVTSVGYDQLIYTYTYTNQTQSNPSTELYLTQSGTPITFTIQDQTSDPIIDAFVEAQAFINGSYVTVASQNTDVTGSVTFSLISTNAHRVLVSASGFDNTQADFNQFVLTEYTITLNSDTDIDFTLSYNDVQYYYAPTNYSLGLGMNTFTLYITSPTNTLSSYSVVLLNGSTPLTANSGTNSAGDNLSITYDVTAFNGSFVTFVYSFTVIGEETQNFAVTYFINQASQYDGSLLELRDQLQSQLTTTQRIVMFCLFFIVTMILLAVFIRGFENLLISLGISLIAGYLFGINLFILGTVVAIFFIGVFAFGDRVT